MPANDGSLGKLLMQQTGMTAAAAEAIDKAINDAGIGGDGSGLGGSGSVAVQQFQSLGNVSGATAINLSSGPNVAMTVTGATTLSFGGLPANNTAQRVVLTITNGGAGAITWPAGTRWMGAGIVGSAPTLVATGVEKIAIDITNNGGTITYDAAYLGRVA